MLERGRTSARSRGLLQLRGVCVLAWGFAWYWSASASCVVAPGPPESKSQGRTAQNAAGPLLADRLSRAASSPWLPGGTLCVHWQGNGLASGPSRALGHAVGSTCAPPILQEPPMLSCTTHMMLYHVGSPTLTGWKAALRKAACTSRPLRQSYRCGTTAVLSRHARAETVFIPDIRAAAQPIEGLRRVHKAAQACSSARRQPRVCRATECYGGLLGLAGKKSRISSSITQWYQAACEGSAACA